MLHESILELTIVADTNDADYVSQVSVIAQEDLDRFMPVIEAIRDTDNQHNWETNEYSHGPRPESAYAELGEDLVEEFNESFVPYGEHGVHTIAVIQIRELIVLSDKDLLK